MNPETIWYTPHHPLSHLLAPLSWVYAGVVRARRRAYLRGWLARRRAGVPVIVVGNLTVGGTGKTPLVIALAGLLRRCGRRPGVVTRGYGGRAGHWPCLVGVDSDPFLVGDEPVVIARRAGCPVAAGRDRVAAAGVLVEAAGCDIIVTDDGLQHYRLARDLEIEVVDAARGYGNGRCLPAGPLREPPARARTVDLTVCNGGPCPGGMQMRLEPGRLVRLSDRRQTRPLEALAGQPVTAVAGIGNPRRFFDLLRGRGLDPIERPYRDHHRFTAADVASWPAGAVVMTEKDAVKCAGFAGPDHWYLPVEARLEPALEERLSSKIEALIHG